MTPTKWGALNALVPLVAISAIGQLAQIFAGYSGPPKLIQVFFAVIAATAAPILFVAAGQSAAQSIDAAPRDGNVGDRETFLNVLQRPLTVTSATPKGVKSAPNAGRLVLGFLFILSVAGIWFSADGLLNSIFSEFGTFLTGRGAWLIPLYILWLATTRADPVQAWIVRKILRKAKNEDGTILERPDWRVVLAASLSRIEVGFFSLLGLLHIWLGHPSLGSGLAKAGGLVGQIFGGTATTIAGDIVGPSLLVSLVVFPCFRVAQILGAHGGRRAGLIFLSATTLSAATLLGFGKTLATDDYIVKRSPDGNLAVYAGIDAASTTLAKRTNVTSSQFPKDFFSYEEISYGIPAANKGDALRVAENMRKLLVISSKAYRGEEWGALTAGSCFTFSRPIQPNENNRGNCLQRYSGFVYAVIETPFNVYPGNGDGSLGVLGSIERYICKNIFRQQKRREPLTLTRSITLLKPTAENWKPGSTVACAYYEFI